MLVYVDDILITGNRVSDVDSFITALSSRFVTRDLGEFDFFLGIEAVKQSDGLVITPSCDFSIHAFSDSDWAGSSLHRRSTGGYVVYLGSNLVPGSPRNKEQWLAPVLNLNIRRLQTALLRFPGLSPYVVSCIFRLPNLLYYDQLDDVLTKPFSTSRFAFFRSKLRLRSRQPSACEGSIG
ncbi:hypothetical protein LIER_16304 [Lithospermum erythrorhizon]|uniref:Reverse transcriptase Ty1/copia-type domain-containing protein n=1 Tax=Lithospermum erythrorhizon TaxID=34254 RepID=A0AAV3Q648_LITER